MEPSSRPEGAAQVPSAALRADGGSRIEDPTAGSALHGRGGYGNVVPGGALELDPLETVYLTEMERLKVHGPDGVSVGFRDLLAQAHVRDSAFEIRYLVYRDLRQRGYVVLRGAPPLEFSLLPRGGTPSKTPSKWWVESRSERVPFCLPELTEHLAQVRGARRTLLVGIIDEESDLTYYRVREVLPHGESPPPNPLSKVDGVLLGDRVSIFDAAQAQALDKSEHFGSKIGERLELSLLEALYLEREGRLTLQSSKGTGMLLPKDFESKASQTEPDLLARLPVYQHLRAQGLVPKTGFKYGAHFRAYEHDPASSHARYLVHVVPANWSAPWPEVARAIRLAQGVRKQLLLASLPPGDSAPRYLHLERMRP
ncbi:MAG: tRNA-intron lyase [Euryarchaeota archaeon]|nr:tRNA-intron lyase [Euryarchaeota archaeon]MDE1837099.1 tRNA-intron lyase [Euryarchaeota archaeon]MDE1879689.1 tRNA-intron lyase [Euryarchaeota archaeon]MDE2045215.1 tRNA-intron lyase [Thermoplasmata archaeon]